MKKVLCLFILLLINIVLIGCSPSTQYDTIKLTTINYSTYLSCNLYLTKNGQTVDYNGSCYSKSSTYVFSNVRIDISGSAQVKYRSIGSGSTSAGMIISLDSKGSGSAYIYDPISEPFDYIYNINSLRVNAIYGDIKIPIE